MRSGANTRWQCTRPAFGDLHASYTQRRPLGILDPQKTSTPRQARPSDGCRWASLEFWASRFRESTCPDSSKDTTGSR